MQRCGWTRVKAILLALIFLGEMGGPALDEILYHSKPGADQLQTHWETRNGCQRHGDHCLLGSSITWPRVPPARAVSLREVALDPGTHVADSPSIVAPSFTGFEARPRAPPQSLA
jgi:hypothetical protein